MYRMLKLLLDPNAPYEAQLRICVTMYMVSSTICNMNYIFIATISTLLGSTSIIQSTKRSLSRMKFSLLVSHFTWDIWCQMRHNTRTWYTQWVLVPSWNTLFIQNLSCVPPDIAMYLGMELIDPFLGRKSPMMMMFFYFTDLEIQCSPLKINRPTW